MTRDPLPLGDILPPDTMTCTRIVRRNGRRTTCASPAPWHVILNAELDHGWACDPHHDEIVREWIVHAIHRVADCGMPGAVFLATDNTCRVPDDDDPFAYVHDGRRIPVPVGA